MTTCGLSVFSMKSLKPCSKDWYQQPVFSHLNEQQRKALIEKRKANCGANIGHMLLATSLAKQLDFREKVRSSLLPFFLFLW